MAKRRKKGQWPKPKPQKPPATKQAAAAAEMDGLPTYALVAAMNAVTDALRRRGQLIRDWDEKDKVIQKFSVLGGKVYALAPRQSPTEVHTHGDGDQKPGG